MKTLAAAFFALNIAMFSQSALCQQPVTERPKFHVEIHSSAEKGSTYIVTNLSGKPVWAVVLEISSSSQPVRKSKKVWDSASISQYLANFGRSPLPDKIEVIAAVWTDGETFGMPASVNSILNIRALRAAEYEDAAGILQRGLSQNWTRDQFQQAFRDKPDTGAAYTVRTALSTTQQTAQTPKDFTRAMQFLLTSFQQLSSQLRKVKPI